MPIDTKKLRELEAKIEPGPWCCVAIAEGVAFSQNECDLIAAMRNNLIEMLDRIDFLERKNESLASTLEDMLHPDDKALPSRESMMGGGGNGSW